MFDKGLEYDSKINDIELLIYKLGNIGFNCTNLVNSLNKIKEDTIISLDNIRNNKEIDAPVKHMLLDGVYTESLGKLKDLEITIFEDEKYYKVMNKLSDLNDLINNNTLDKLTIENYVNELIECIKIVRNSSIKDHREKESITDYLYEIVYKMIKIELKLTNKSKLLDYCTLNNIDISYLNELVKEDIESKKKEKNIELENVVNELNDLDDDYVDKSLITLLSGVSYTTKEEELKDIKQKLKEIMSLYKNNNSKINKLEKKANGVKNRDIASTKIEFIFDDLKELLANTGLFLLSVGVAFGLIKGASLIKHKHNVYNVTTYTQNDDSYKYEEEEKCSHNTASLDKLAIKVCEPYVKLDNKYVRTVTTYTFDEKSKVTNLSDYLSFSLDDYSNLKHSTSTEEKISLGVQDHYTEDLIQVVYKEKTEEIVPEKCIYKSALTISICFLLIIFEFMPPNPMNDFSLSVVENLYNLYDSLTDLIEDIVSNYDLGSETIDKLRKIDDEIRELAIENEELDSKYKEILSVYGKEYKSLYNKNDEGLSRTLSR